MAIIIYENIRNQLLIGKILKIHSDFYYVKINDVIYECKVREILKKQKNNIYTGDNVKISAINELTNQAVIEEILPRENFIPRPSVANIDQIIIVSALKEPDLDLTSLNRYLSHARLYSLKTVLCFNKDDLSNDDNTQDKIISIYKPLKYKIIFTSAKEKTGIDELESILAKKTSALCGNSGVGKSSLINAIHPGLNLRTREVSEKTLHGRHTTRHSEIIEVNLQNGNNAQIVDTPGFSHLKFDNIMPAEIKNLFSEISEFGQKCKFNDCLHLHEQGCNVLDNINKIEPSRYESYVTFVKEAMEFKNKIQNSGSKTEDKIKTIDSNNDQKIMITKLGSRAREKARNIKKQKLNHISSLEDAYYNEE